eukprot:EG_transcript_58752
MPRITTLTPQPAAKHPPYMQLVQEAIRTCGKPVRGASRQAILKYIQTRHGADIGARATLAVRRALREGQRTGLLVRTKGGQGDFRVAKGAAGGPRPQRAAVRGKGPGA